MKNLKVRAWDKTRKQMFKSPKWVEFSVNIKGELSAKNYDYEGNEQALEILQYTGLRDKNGIDVYEGDILTEADDDYTICTDRIYIADYLEHECAFALIAIQKYPCNGRKFIPHVMYDCEVIGNIYENPELVGE